MYHPTSSRYFFALLGLLFCIQANTQSRISGLVVDQKGETLAFANVVLLSLPDSSFLSGTTTDEQGTFSLRRDSSQGHLLAIHLLGFSSAFVSIPANEAYLKMSPIVLREGGIDLQAIEVTAEKPLLVQALDRTIVNLENRIAKVGTSVLDLLEKLPGVIVDRQNESISILGKDGLALLINDRQQYLTEEALFNYLAGLNADNLSAVELITTPPANFDAEGNAGFINLRLKQYPGDGWNGSYAVAAGYGNGELVNGNLDFNYRKHSLAFAANYTGSHHGQRQFGRIERRVGSGDSFLETNSLLERDPYVNSHNLRLVMDYQLNPRTRFGSVLTHYRRHWNMDAAYDIVFRPLSGLDTLITASLFEENDWESLQGNLNFSHEWNENMSISADLDYLWFDNSNPIDYDFSYQLSDGQALPGFNLVSDKVTPFVIRVGRVDFRNQLSPRLQWSSGLKTSFSTFENDVSVRRNQVELSGFTSLNDLQEIIGAVYTQFDYKLSDKVQFKAGLRYEYSDSELGNAEGELLVDRTFGTLFPTLYAQFGAFNLAYGKRINRPSFSEMAPFQVFVGPNTSNQGNPGLQPAISHNVSANYRWKTISFSIQYTKEDSTIASFQNRFDPITNTQTILPRNLQQEEYVDLSISSPISFTPWWTMRFFAGFSYVEAVTQEALGKFKFHQSRYSANVNQFISLPKDWTLEVSAFYRSVGLNGNVRTQAYGGLNVGLQKKFTKGTRLTLTLSDLLESIQNIGITDLPTQHIYVSRLSDFSNRTFRISYQQSFGDKKVKGIKAVRQTEERRRVN